ncbi:MAG: hypothetical protein JNL62_16745 [Bryobacterales bacterium]|nr:hypothetical protein [Bryobacterales bacterium]
MWWLLLMVHGVVLAETYEVGPGRALESIGAVPWARLQPGDTVLIHHREEPYREKWVICARGTEDAPITVRGVMSADGQRPVIEGADAVTAPGLNYWSEQRGVIKIGGANVPSDTMPAFVVVENLEIRGARTGNRFRDDVGAPQVYGANASAIYLEKGERITVRNCVMHDSGNGLFVASGAGAVSRDILIEGNYLYGNGNVGSAFEHNSYTAAVGITFQFNRYGPLREGAVGNNLKDRSAGLVVRWNWIEGGNRQLDLVDAEDSAVIVEDASYRETYVYGNVLKERDGDGNRQIVHYGGDSGTVRDYRKGTLHFFHNTVVSLRTDRTTLFRLSTNEEKVDVRNNIFYVIAGGNTVSLVDQAGQMEMRRNWMKPGWVGSFSSVTGTIVAEDWVEGDAGLRNVAEDDFVLTAESGNRGAAVEWAPGGHVAEWQYKRHQTGEKRKDVRDVGALGDVVE